MSFPRSSAALDSVLYSFSQSDGTPAPYGTFAVSGGTLYGMTVNGGSEGAGTIFCVNTDGSNYTVLHTFTNDGLNSDGASPFGSLTLAGSVLYGMTQAGGIVSPAGPSANAGTVFSINTDGTGFQVLHGFTGSQLAGSNDGAAPYGAVTVVGSTLYGLTRFGGANASGTVFAMNSDGTNFQILHSFGSSEEDGLEPQGSLTLAGATLYGLTSGGGANGQGAIFSVNTDGSGFALLYSFGNAGASDALGPVDGNGLVLAGNQLYGMTYNGGANNLGAIFCLNPDGTNYSVLHSFIADEGGTPYGALNFSGGHLYGTASGFYGNTFGTVFSINPDGSQFTAIHNFSGIESDGVLAIGSLAVSADGASLYGTTEFGGANSNGVIFSTAASGSQTNAFLSNFTFSVGNLTPAFYDLTSHYVAFVSDATTSLTVTAPAINPAATVTVNGNAVASGAASVPVNLNTGTNFLNIQVTAADGVTTSTYVATVVRLTNLESWRLANFGVSASVGLAADTADFDGNGIPNLAKYAFGLDPTDPAANAIPQPGFAGNNFGFAFTEPAGICGIQYGAESTGGLNPPAWAPVTDAGADANHVFTVPTASLPSLFMRLTFSIPLSPIEQLGKDLFFDDTLSNPTGMACATCHSPTAGFTGPDSNVNLTSGPLPGVVSGRFGHRKPQAIPYSTFSPYGPYFDNGAGVWIGGNFWDGRTPNNAAQARMPLLDADEMANTPVGPYPPHAGGYSPLVAQKISTAPYATLFCQVFGAGVFQSNSAADIYAMATQAIAAYEATTEVNPFSSKFDAVTYGAPPINSAQLTASEQNGLNLFFGKAQCFQCHSSAGLDTVSSLTNGREVFTMYCYANIGVPKNPNNPFYQEQDSVNNPYGYNPLGAAFIDYGLGGNPNPAPDGTTFFMSTPGDMAAFRGLFKAPSLRNVDQRPSPDFVKSYTHNGVFKSLEEVVHFYNKRNIAVDGSGNEMSFDLRLGPPAGFTPLFAPPEVLDNVQNVAGLSPGIVPSVVRAGAGAVVPAVAPGLGEVSVATNGQIGNLGLTADEETDLVNFLKTLTDGFSCTNAP